MGETQTYNGYRRSVMIEIDMRDGWNEAAAWYALALLVEQQGEEGERIRGRDDVDLAKADMEERGER